MRAALKERGEQLVSQTKPSFLKRRDFCELWLRTGSSAPSELAAFFIGTQGFAKPPPWARFSYAFGVSDCLLFESPTPLRLCLAVGYRLLAIGYLLSAVCHSLRWGMSLLR